MKHIVKCFCCDKEFEVKREENGAEIICPECGGKNNIRSVIERIEKEDAKNIDEDIQNIQSFDLGCHPVEDNSPFSGYEENERTKMIVIALVVLVILGILRMLRLMFVPV